MKILAIETSGQVCGTAVLEEDTLVAEYTLQYKKTHSQSLIPMMDELRAMCGLELSTVDAIALTAGPGSFTGVRIGAATAKGLGMALDRPLIPVPTVDSLAGNLYATGNHVICPIMDARRGQVYSGIYEFCAYQLHVLEPQCAASLTEMAARLNALGRPVIFLGDGVPVYRAQLGDIMEVPYSFAPPQLSRQRAATTAVLAMQAYRERGVACLVNPDDFRPAYLRLSQAERERKEGIDTSRVVRR